MIPLITSSPSGIPIIRHIKIIEYTINLIDYDFEIVTNLDGDEVPDNDAGIRPLIGNAYPGRLVDRDLPDVDPLTYPNC